MIESMVELISWTIVQGVAVLTGGLVLVMRVVGWAQALIALVRSVREALGDLEGLNQKQLDAVEQQQIMVNQLVEINDAMHEFRAKYIGRKRA